MKNKNAFYKKEYEVSPLLGVVLKYLHKSERGNENFIKYLRMYSNPSPQVTDDSSLMSTSMLVQFYVEPGSGLNVLFV